MINAELISLANDLLAAHSCCAELKEAVQAWLDAEGDEAATKALIAELEDDVMTVDQVIAVMAMDDVRAHLGAELADSILTHAKEIKAAGAVYCDCPACSAGLKLLQAIK